MNCAATLTGDHFTGIINTFLLVLWAYAEIHYRWPLFRGRLFMREPEIIFDMPSRIEPGEGIPLFLFVKDAHRYPLYLGAASIEIRPLAAGVPVRHYRMEFERPVDAYFYEQTVELQRTLFEGSGDHEVTVTLDYRVAEKDRQLRQDNYATLPHPPFRVHIAADPLPTLPGLLWGDLHLHSSFTDDQIEFGAPLVAMRRCAQAMGLRFMAVTDHSYDLDDCEEDYARQDPELPKWRRLRETVAAMNRDTPAVVILPGEEVSAGNRRRQNVHCLVLGCERFFPGSGDSGEHPLTPFAELSLPALVDAARSVPGIIIAAAHPFERPPLAHRLLLNRGWWRRKDLADPRLDFWQIMNGDVGKAFHDGRAAWISALLSGQRIGIIAGSDAHGNFNNARQVRIPFWELTLGHEQVFGSLRTGIFNTRQHDEEGIMATLGHKTAIISNGPAAQITVTAGERRFPIGAVIAAGDVSCEVDIAAASTAEFGTLHEVLLYRGNIGAQAEEKLPLAATIDPYDFRDRISLPRLAGPAYLRLEVTTRREDRVYRCLTNPIWFS